MSTYIIKNDSYLAHYGVQGMKWGVRNYQNYDGSYTAQGRSRYGIESSRSGGGRSQYNSQRYKASSSSSKEQGTTERKKMSPETKKKIALAAVGVLAAAAVTAGVVVAAKNPEATKNIINKIGTGTVNGISKAGTAVKNTATKIADNSNKRALANYRTAMKTGDITKAAKIVSSGKLAKASPIVAKMGNEKFKTKWVTRNWEQLKTSPAGVNYLKRTIAPMEKSVSMFKQAKNLNDSMNQIDNLAKTFNGIGKVTKIATGVVTGAGAVTGALVSGKKIINDLNNLYTTQNLPVVKDYLNSPNGQKTNNIVNGIKDKIFGTKVEEIKEK